MCWSLHIYFIHVISYLVEKKLSGRSGSLFPYFSDLTCSFLFYAVIAFFSCLSFPRESFLLTNYAQEHMVARQLHACF